MNITNLILACHHHHHLLHEGGYTATMTPNQELHVQRPDSTPLHLHRLPDAVGVTMGASSPG